MHKDVYKYVKRCIYRDIQYQPYIRMQTIWLYIVQTDFQDKLEVLKTRLNLHSSKE